MQQLKCIPSQLFNKKLLLILIYECLFLNCNIRPSSLKVESMKKSRRSKSSVPWSYYRVWQRESNARSLELIGGFSRRRSESEGSICKEAYLSIEAFFSPSLNAFFPRGAGTTKGRGRTGEGPLAVAVPRVVFIVIRTWPFLRRRPRFFAS